MKPIGDAGHTFERGCRYGEGGLDRQRRRKIELGERAKSGPVRDPAIPAAGVRESEPVTTDLNLDGDVQTNDNVIVRDTDDVVHDEDEPLGILGTIGRGAVTKEERRSEVPTNSIQNPPLLYWIVPLI